MALDRAQSTRSKKAAKKRNREHLFDQATQEVKDKLLSFEKVLLEKNAKKRAQLLDRIFHANLGMATTGLSPVALIVAYTGWYTQMATSPNKRLQLAQSAYRKLFEFCEDFYDYFTENNTHCFQLKDKYFHQRFKEKVWNNWPYCVFAKLFLEIEDWWQEATDARGLEKNHKELVSFIRYQWINALSPENIPILNPLILEKVKKTKGQNLLEGLKNWQEDIWRYFMGEKPAGTEKYIVGKDLAITPGKVVYRNELIELIQYTPQTKTVYPEPVLCVPAWIMKYYVLDLSPQNSLVNYLVKKGHTVFMISWKNPDARYRDYGMEDYLKRGILKAVDAITVIAGQPKIHALGYCIGGTLLTMAASYLTRQNNHCLKTMTLFAAQTDFDEPGELMTFIDETQLCYLEDIMFSQGYLRGDQMSAAFELLRPKELIWSKAVQRNFLGEQNSIIDLVAWNEDTTRLPYKMHSEYLRHFHLNNDLAEGNYTIDGESIAIGDIETPMFVVATEKDHIAPWKSVYKIHLYTQKTEITFVLANMGHNGGIISEPGHKGRGYRLGKMSIGSRYETPEKWYAQHEYHSGSWWPVWHEWLAKQSGNKKAPPTLGAPQKGYEVLEDAPGTYVKEK